MGRNLNRETSKYEAVEPPTTLSKVLEKLTMVQTDRAFS